jgi:hypothetical protein
VGIGIPALYPTSPAEELTTIFSLGTSKCNERKNLQLPTLRVATISKI